MDQRMKLLSYGEMGDVAAWLNCLIERDLEPEEVKGLLKNICRRLAVMEGFMADAERLGWLRDVAANKTVPSTRKT